MWLVVVQTYHQRKDILYLNASFMILTSLEWNLILFESRASTTPFLVYLEACYVALSTDCTEVTV